MSTVVAGSGQPVSLRKIVAASVAGNALEWYDFFLYGTAAALVFGQLFFPVGTDPLTGTLAAFAGFAVGFIARPFGAVIFGHIGDRIGRRTALVATLFIMGASTFLIGLLPTYATIGIWAPIGLVMLRLLQGMAAGGEWGGGVLIISENAPANRRGFYAAWSQAGVAGGFVLSAAAFLAVQQLPPEDFLAWGWRLPFLGSVVLFGVGAYIRHKLPETEDFSKAEKAGKSGTHAAKKAGMPWLRAFKEHPKGMLVGMGLRIAESGGSYIFLAFSLAYGKYIGVSNTVMLAGVMISMTLALPAMIAYGALSDRIGRRPVYLMGTLGLMIVAFPFFWMIATKDTALVILAFVLANTLCHAAMIGTQPSFYTELFSTDVRYSGISIGREIASVVGGGFAPFIATALLSRYQAAWPVSLYLIFLAAVTTAAVLYSRGMTRNT